MTLKLESAPIGRHTRAMRTVLACLLAAFVFAARMTRARGTFFSAAVQRRDLVLVLVLVFVRRFGGTSITMSAPEVPSALDRGVVDGIFTAGVGAVLWKDLLKYGYVLIINVNNSYFIANTEAYNKLSPDLQAKLRKVAEESARWDQDTMKKEEADSVQTLRALGYTFTNAKPEEVARAVETMKPYWDEWAKSRGPEIVEALAKVRTALGR